MQGTCFLDKSVVVASIMYTKNKHFGQMYVSPKECLVISERLRNLLFIEGLDVVILDTMNRDYFEIMGGAIVINSKNKHNLQDIKDTYMTDVSVAEVMNIIWNDSLIFNYLSDIKDDNKKLDFELAKLDEIVNRILDNPKLFYENIALELSREEYEYLKRKVEIKSCKNCTSYCSGGSKGYLCGSWSNDELIGRSKVKKNNLIFEEYRL